jgi:hypothetical protein
MSRAMNLSMAEADVTDSCRKAGVSISTSETLPEGGTHLVCTTGDGADEMRMILRKHIITGKVKRFAFVALRASR